MKLLDISIESLVLIMSILMIENYKKMVGIKPSHIPDFEINMKDSNLKKVHDGLSNDQIFSMLTPEEAKIYFYSTSLNHIVWNRIRNSIIQLVCVLNILYYHFK